MASNCSQSGKFTTIIKGYKGSPEKEIAESFMGGPTRANFTGCGGAGWNAFKPPCTQCNGTGRYGSRICNACRNNANVSGICGGTLCAWQPPTDPGSFYF